MILKEEAAYESYRQPEFWDLPHYLCSIKGGVGLVEGEENPGGYYSTGSVSCMLGTFLDMGGLCRQAIQKSQFACARNEFGF